MDCRNIFILRQELDRMCESMTGCEKCGLRLRPLTGCGNLNDYGAEEVDIVQKWSDEHPIDDKKYLETLYSIIYGEDD